MARLLTLDDLQRQFDATRDKLALDRREILALCPLKPGYSRDLYSFSYMRAQRLCMGVIDEALRDILWLPMQLDPETEIVMEDKSAIKKWLASSSMEQPDGTVFGNDFVHALTRLAITNGWDSDVFRSTALRIGWLFHDLSCLVGLIYYGVWMAENGISAIPVSDPFDLEGMAREIAQILRSPEVAHIVTEHNRAMERKVLSKKRGPLLHVIDNPSWEPDGPRPLN